MKYKDLILIYSLDDNGFYAQDPKDEWKTSEKYKDIMSLKCAIDDNLINWS